MGVELFRNPTDFSKLFTLDLGPVPAAEVTLKWWWWKVRESPRNPKKTFRFRMSFFICAVLFWGFRLSSWNSLSRKSTCCLGRKGHNSSNHQSLSFVAIYRSYILSPSKSLPVFRSGILPKPSFVTRYLGWVLVSYPRCSMNGIFTYIYHIFDPNVGSYISYIIWYITHGAFGYTNSFHRKSIHL